MRYNEMRVLVNEIITPAASTITYGAGVDPAGRAVLFCGDRRPMAAIQRALDLKPDVPVIATVDNWQLIGGNADK
jgi:hypothetical protein